MNIVNKPWGYEMLYEQDEEKDFVIKQLYIKKGHRFSLQKHERKWECMIIIQGKPTFTLGEATIYPERFSIIDIQPSTVHRVYAENSDVVIVEVSSNDLDDVVRISDDYNRIN